MSNRRKLFIAHASELAHRLVRTVGSGGLVARFVRAYAERYNRPGLCENPERARELDSTIGREALLVMTVEVRRLLPSAFAPGRPNHPAPQETALAEAFFAEFLASLGRSLEWPPNEAPAEADAFLRDLEMYQKWSGRSAVRLFGRPAISIEAGESPFADRCALLLDPSMMEQARRAAAAFETEIARTGARIFSRLGRGLPSAGRPRRARRRLTKARAPIRRRKKSPPRRKKTVRRQSRGSRPRR